VTEDTRDELFWVEDVVAGDDFVSLVFVFASGGNLVLLKVRLMLWDLGDLGDG